MTPAEEDCASQSLSHETKEMSKNQLSNTEDEEITEAIDSKGKSVISEYSKNRMKNIEENKKILAVLFLLNVNPIEVSKNNAASKKVKEKNLVCCMSQRRYVTVER